MAKWVMMLATKPGKPEFNPGDSKDGGRELLPKVVL